MKPRIKAINRVMLQSPPHTHILTCTIPRHINISLIHPAGNRNNPLNICVIFRLLANGSVSYTHLDVYKRQGVRLFAVSGLSVMVVVVWLPFWFGLVRLLPRRCNNIFTSAHIWLIFVIR